MSEALTEIPEISQVELPESLALLPMRDLVLFPYMIVPLMVSREVSAAAVDLALGGNSQRLIFVTLQRTELDESPDSAALHDIGTVGTILRMRKLSDGRMKILIQGLFRARMTEFHGNQPCITVGVEQVYDRPDKSIDRDAPLAPRSIDRDAPQAPRFSDKAPDKSPDKPGGDKPPAGDPYGPMAIAEIEALGRQIRDDLEVYSRAGKIQSPELLSMLAAVDEPGRLSDLVCANLQLKVDEGQRLLEELDPLRRLRQIAVFLRREGEIIQMQEIIQSRAKEVLSRTQREHFLREQLRQIHSELGGGEDGGEVPELRRRVAEAGLSGEALVEAERQLRRLESMQSAMAEYQVLRTYLDWLVDLPWQRQTEDQLDLTWARRVLDEDHYDLEKVKDRILEFLSVLRLRGMSPAPTPGVPWAEDRGYSTVLCFVGPPGVGKTSLGRSIARALGRRFVRVCLGGVRDDAEIRGHRRTYVGALPGRLIQGMRQAGYKNPVMMLDEIDKLGADVAGDPAASLLEVLDPEQNIAFRDHYLQVPFDLSQVLFIATANAADRIPQALRDRLELIQLSGYSEQEKLAIAQRHVVPRAIYQAGLGQAGLGQAAVAASGNGHGEAGATLVTAQRLRLRFTEAALSKVIADYTREAGLRELDRQIAAICRKIAREVVEREDQRRAFAGPLGPIQPVIPERPRTVVITPKAVERYLGPPMYRRFQLGRSDDQKEGGAESGKVGLVGTAVGLAWTPVGGEVLEIETQSVPGKGSLILTGQLGDVMKESAQAALSYARARAAEMGLPEGFYSEREIHIHVPAGSVPKDGPSAGVTMACALVSLLTQTAVRGSVAMTGEISLRGRVLPVGGIKEKLLAALRAGIATVLVPEANRRDLDEIPRSVLRGLKVVLVRTMDDVLREALVAPFRKSTERAEKANRHGAGRLLKA